MVRFRVCIFAIAWILCYPRFLTAQTPSAVLDIGHLDLYDIRPSDSLLVIENERYLQAERQDDRLKQALSLQKMGQICYNSGLFAQSLNYHLQAEKLLERGNQSQRAANLNDLALLLFLNNQREEAKRLYFQALNSYKRSEDVRGQGNTYGNLGHLYEKCSDYDSAFYFQQKAMQAFEQINDLDGIALINENLGSIYEDKGRYVEAYQYFTKALNRFKANGNIPMLIDAYNNIGDINRKTGKYQEALIYTGLAEKLAKENKAWSRLSSAYRDLGKTYSFLKNADSAFYYLELSRKLYIEIYNEDSKNQAALLKVLYDIDRKDARIAQLAKERRTAIIIYATLGIIACLLVLLFIIVVRNQRQKIRNERQLRDQETDLLQAKQRLMEVELQNKKLQEEQLQIEIESKAKEITSHTLQAIEKNKLLEEMKLALTEIIRNDSRSYKKELRQLLNKINQSFHKEASWVDFRRVFEEINQDFFLHLQQINPDLSAADLRLVSLIKLNMNTPDMAALLGISTDSLRVSRYRLRKKLGVEPGKSLTAFLQAI